MKIVFDADIELDKADDINDVWRDTLADLFEYMGRGIRASEIKFTGKMPVVKLSYERQRWSAMLSLELELP